MILRTVPEFWRTEKGVQSDYKPHSGDVEVISRKAADLAVKVAQLQSQLDEEQSRALSAEEELAKAKVERPCV